MGKTYEEMAADFMQVMSKRPSPMVENNDQVADNKPQRPMPELNTERRGRIPLHTINIRRGKHHRIGVISDTHIGSVYSPSEWFHRAIDTIEEHGCECVLHCGDLTEGIKAARKTNQVYEIEPDCISYPGMRQAAIAELSAHTIPYYIISGNHDRFFQDAANITADICERVPNAHFLGHDCADVVIGGVKIRLFHGEDGFSNMRLKNLAFSNQVDHNNVSILLAGHVHKYEVKWIDHAYMVNVPCLQAQSSWMAAKKLIADCGFLIIDFDAVDGKLERISIEYYPFE